MAPRQHDIDAEELRSYFRSVIEWVETVFPTKRPQLMQDVDWGALYAAHRDDSLNPVLLEAEIVRLASLDSKGKTSPIRRQSGIYPYVLDGDERHLNLRAFTKAQKTAAYERQGGRCAGCDRELGFGRMEGDRIRPWTTGGLTEDDNLQMLCKPCNRSKGAQ